MSVIREIIPEFSAQPIVGLIFASHERSHTASPADKRLLFHFSLPLVLLSQDGFMCLKDLNVRMLLSNDFIDPKAKSCLHHKSLVVI